MVKLVEFLVRDDEYSHEEFVEHWQGEHAELASELPGLERYSTSVPGNPTEVEYDGVLELTFENSQALNEAFKSEVGQEVQEDAAEFTIPGKGPRLVVGETVHVSDSGQNNG
ncbi:ethyl tert-butyl ether degradation EthD [Natrialba hulunbeirensis JCM 10989]|uniref:Ethyl tert-butyl ether degradation EthD n=1 Tax=Natrialba hulunbeirensis JCM 10989 TaxID=1227493 RepID=M0AE68_9EURY|nr:EthD family reductase [Natrialba hulunbeirensis]ELY96167.1 ethyl tert-butyl ether degradation EthD [Natrialba hulunbeirensis JCM 10989]